MLKLRSLPFKWQGFNLFVTKILAHLLHPFSRILLRAPLKIHISSLPRRRESSQINKLDSRLPPAFARVTGNDEFLEVPLSQALTIFLHDPGGHEVKQGYRTEAVNRPQSLSENII